MESERRRGTRARFQEWVELVIASERRLARSRDLSAWGLGLEIDGPHPGPGDPVESEFALPGFGVPLAVAELLESAVAGRFERG